MDVEARILTSGIIWLLKANPTIAHELAIGLGRATLAKVVWVNRRGSSALRPCSAEMATRSDRRHETARLRRKTVAPSRKEQSGCR